MAHRRRRTVTTKRHLLAASAAVIVCVGCSSQAPQSATSSAPSTANISTAAPTTGAQPASTGQSSPAASSEATGSASSTSPGGAAAKPAGYWLQEPDGDSFTLIQTDVPVVDFASSASTLFLVGEDGSVWACTRQCQDDGIPEKLDLPAPAADVAATSTVVYVMGTDNQLYAVDATTTDFSSTEENAPPDSSTFTQGAINNVDLGGDVVDIAAFGGQGEGTVYAVLDDGVIWAWGDPSDGRLGDNRPIPTGAAGTAEPQPVQGISTAVSVSVWGGAATAVLADGTAMTWGFISDAVGETSKPLPLEGAPPLKGTAGLLGLAQDGTVWSWFVAGNNSGASVLDDPVQVIGPKDVAVLTGQFIVDGRGKAWGLEVQDDGSVSVTDSTAELKELLPPEYQDAEILYSAGISLVIAP